MAPLSTALSPVPLAAFCLLAGAPAGPWADDCVTRGSGALGAKKLEPALEGEDLFLVWSQSPRLAGRVGEVPGVADVVGEGIAHPGWEHESWLGLLENRAGRFGVAEHEEKIREIMARRFEVGGGDPLELLGGGFLAGRLAAPDAFAEVNAEGTASMMVEFLQRNPEAFAGSVHSHRAWNVQGLDEPRRRAELILERRAELAAEIPGNARSLFAQGFVVAMDAQPDVFAAQGSRFVENVVGVVLKEHGHGRIDDEVDTVLSTFIRRTGNDMAPDGALGFLDKAAKRGAEQTMAAIVHAVPARAMDVALETAIREGKNLENVAALLGRAEGFETTPERAYELLDATVSTKGFVHYAFNTGGFAHYGPIFVVDENQDRVLKELILRTRDIFMDHGRWEKFWSNEKIVRNFASELGYHNDESMGPLFEALVRRTLGQVSKNLLNHMLVAAKPRLFEKITGFIDARPSDFGKKESYDLFKTIITRAEGLDEPAATTLLERIGKNVSPAHAGALLGPSMRAGVRPRVVMTLLERAGPTVSPERAAEVERWMLGR